MIAYHASGLCLLHACNSATVGAIMTIRLYGSTALTSLSLMCKSSFKSKIVHFDHVTLSFPADITGDWLAPAGMLTYQSQILYNHLCPSCLPSSTIEVKSAEPLYSFGSMYVLMGTRCTNRYSIEYTMERTDVNILLAECRSMITSYNSAPKQTNSGKP